MKEKELAIVKFMTQQHLDKDGVFECRATMTTDDQEPYEFEHLFCPVTNLTLQEQREVRAIHDKFIQELTTMLGFKYREQRPEATH